MTTKRFFSKQLERGRLRYKQVKSNPSSDYFRFIATVPGSDLVSEHSDSTLRNTASEEEHTFQIKVISNNFQMKSIYGRESL